MPFGGKPREGGRGRIGRQGLGCCVLIFGGVVVDGRLLIFGSAPQAGSGSAVLSILEITTVDQAQAGSGSPAVHIHDLAPRSCRRLS